MVKKPVTEIVKFNQRWFTGFAINLRTISFLNIISNDWTTRLPLCDKQVA